MKIAIVAVLAVCLAVQSLARGADGPSVDRLRCEYRTDPLGIDVVKPRLSWIIKSDRRGQRQTAYQVLVASTPQKLAADRGDLWDSGKVSSDETIHVAYAGKPLASRMRCHWKVRVWDAHGEPTAWSEPAIWSMGLLQPEDWQARWIAADTGPAEELTPHNGFHTQFAQSAETEKWVTLDLGKARRFDAVRLWPARPYNYSPDTPGFLFPLRFKIEVSETKDFAEPRVVVDRTDSDVPNPGTEPLTLRFKPVTARYVRLRATRLRVREKGDDNYAMALAEIEVLDGEKNVAQDAAVAASDSIEAGDWSTKNLVDGRLQSDRGGAGLQPATLLRREFTLEAAVERATLFVTGLGLYEVHLNGRRVGKGLLAPEYTRYVCRVQYRTFDVTDLLRSGPNAVAAMLGDGWHGDRFWGAPAVKNRKFQGRRGLRLRLDVELTGGKTVTLVTDPTWRVNNNGPVRRAGMYDGEFYDARMEQPGWDTPGFDDRAWGATREVEFPGTQLVWQPNEPLRVTRELTPVKLTEPEEGVYVFDLGQNMVGWCRLKVRGGQAGDEISLRHAERLNEDGTAYFANLRSAKQRDVYICRGDDEESFEPHFTYHGFRYVEVRGLPSKPEKNDLLGRVFNSSAPEVGRFECSNRLINQLMHNAFWSQLGNLTTIPTDCPQRDERAGWMGDIQAFSQTAILNMDMAAFFTKWLADVRDSQAEDGRFSCIAPHPGNPNEGRSGAPAWADAGVFVPWRVYQNYADKRLLEQHIDAARRWIDFIHQHNPELVWLNKRGGDWADWLNGDTLVLEGFPRKGNAVPKEILATAFWHETTRMLSKMYVALGREDEAAKYAHLAGGIRKAFNERFVDDDGRITGDTQAGYALALRFGLLDDRRQEQAVEHLLAAIDRYHGHLSTGIQTTHRTMLELSRHGQHDVACELINLETVPSWGYTIKMGATTIWERWDGYVEGRGFQSPGMNSFNHWALGSVAEWIWRNVGGLNPDEEHPGWKHFTIAPRPHGAISWARAEYDSIRGPIRSDWRVEDDRITMKITIPPNTSATVRVPTSDVKSVTEGGKPADRAPGVKSIRAEDNAMFFDVTSGSYVFEASLNAPL